MLEETRIRSKNAVGEDRGFDGITCYSTVHSLSFHVSISKGSIKGNYEVKRVMFCQSCINFNPESEWLLQVVEV